MAAVYFQPLKYNAHKLTFSVLFCEHLVSWQLNARKIISYYDPLKYSSTASPASAGKSSKSCSQAQVASSTLPWSVRRAPDESSPSPAWTPSPPPCWWLVWTTRVGISFHDGEGDFSSLRNPDHAVLLLHRGLGFLETAHRFRITAACSIATKVTQ